MERRWPQLRPAGLCGCDGQKQRHTPAGRDDTGKRETVWIEMICPGKTLPYLSGRQFQRVDDAAGHAAEGRGLRHLAQMNRQYQQHMNINNAVRLIQGVGGRVRMVPLKLSIVPQEVTAEGKKKTLTIYCAWI